MSRISKTERLVGVHERSLTGFDRVQSTLRDERLQCLQDRRFYSIAGAMWEGPLGDQYANRPKFEVNKIHLAVIRIFNEYRNNRITAYFLPKNGKKNQNLSDACNDLFRADSQESGAQEAFDNCFEEGTGGGFGAIRLTTQYAEPDDPEDERQVIRMLPVFDADSSVFYLDAKRQDKSDAKKCWVIWSMTWEGFKEKYGRDPASWPKSIHQYEYDWLTPDVVYVAEYFEVEERTETMITMEGLEGSKEVYRKEELDTDPDLVSRLYALGFRPAGERKVKRKKVHKYILDGQGIIEDCGYIAGECIPIVPFYGKRWFVDNVERCMGHVRLPKDMQRVFNMQITKLAELAAESAREKPIMSPQEIAGHQTMWARDNIDANAVLLKNNLLDAAGNIVPKQLEYTKVPQIAPALAALVQLTASDIKEMLGNQELTEDLNPKVSGVALELTQNKLDMQTFIYMSNFAKTVTRVGEVWLSMAKDVLIEEGRIMKGVDLQGETSSIELMRPKIDQETGKQIYENDLADAKMEVSVSVGPTSASKRSAIVRTLSGILPNVQDPEVRQVIEATIMMNMEGEGMEDLRDFYRMKLVKLGAVKPTEEEAQQLEAAKANTPPDPNTVFLMESANKERALAEKAAADTQLANANADVSRAKVGNTQADTVKKLAEAEELGIDSIRKSVDSLGAAFMDQHTMDMSQRELEVAL